MRLSGRDSAIADTFADVGIVLHIPAFIHLDGEGEATFEIAVVNEMLPGRPDGTVFDRLSDVLVGLQVPCLVDLDPGNE